MQTTKTDFHFVDIRANSFFSASEKVETSTQANQIGIKSLSENKYALRFKTYEHRWQCGTFNNCHSAYNVIAFAINLITGEAIRLRAAETAVAIQNENSPIDYDPSKNGYYHHYDDTTEFYIGVGTKEGHDPDYWGVAKCYFVTGEIISWRWHSHA